MGSWENYMYSARFEFERYKTLGDETFKQLSEEEIHWRFNETDNSIAVIVKHLAGNMRSRWTSFLTEDGEKDWRNRENEFSKPYINKAAMLADWASGWEFLFTALNQVNGTNFDSIIKIRNENHTIIEAVNRQLAHYAGHVGQIVLLGKIQKGKDWKSLSIPKDGSQAFNDEKFKR